MDMHTTAEESNTQPLRKKEVNWHLLIISQIAITVNQIAEMSSSSEEDSVMDSLEEEEQSYSGSGSEDGGDALIEANAEDVVDDLEYDVFNLVACDNHALNLTEDGEDLEELLLSSTTRAAQLLMKRYAGMLLRH